MVESKLKTLRDSLGLTQTELAKEIGTTRSNISRYENGNREIPRHLQIILYEKFNVNEKWLLYGDGEMFIEPKKERSASREFERIYEELKPHQKQVLDKLAQFMASQNKETSAEISPFDFSIPTEAVRDDISFLKQTLKQAEKKKDS